ncbi:MAG: DUF4476 domain-containing protein [Bacteroidales bacterium]|nr:DUF4476 domain-containing protein [Bacteroidales bacterium]
MKKIFVAALCVLLAITASAQNKKKSKALEVTISANKNEVFTVYLDGDLQSDAPGKTFTIKNLIPNKTYDLVVYLESPLKYIASADFELSAGHYDLVVYSDTDAGYAEILFANDIATLANNATTLAGSNVANGNAGGGVSTETDVSSILVMFSQEPFDDTRLHYVKSIMPNKKPFLVEQIRRIAAAFTYDKARLKYLKFAYAYCADKENYSSLSNVLSEKASQDAFEEFLKEKK